MASPRVHNLLFALAVGACLGVTAWSVAARDPGGFALPAKPAAAPSPSLPPDVPMAAEAPAAAPAANVIEQQIREGKLSRQPARHWQKVAP